MRIQSDQSRLNEMPTTPVVFAAADNIYFNEFGTEFVYSFSKMGRDVHVHIINPDEECYDLTRSLKRACPTKVTFSHEVTDMDQYRKNENKLDDPVKAYYSCVRWLKMPEILESAGEVMVLDIDCMARKPFVFPHNENLGFFPRFEEDQQTRKVLAGIFYISKERIELANRIKNRILSYPMQWYIDQFSLYEELKDETEYFEFDSNFCDGDCREEKRWLEDYAPIWTGKGSIKYEHSKYLELTKYWRAEFQFSYETEYDVPLKHVTDNTRLDRLVHQIKYYIHFPKEINNK